MNIILFSGAYPILDYPKVLIDINGVKELKGYKIDQNLVIGAAVALTELLDIFKNVGKQEYFEYLTKLYDHLRKVAHIPVRNVSRVFSQYYFMKISPDGISYIKYLKFVAFTAGNDCWELDDKT